MDTEFEPFNFEADFSSTKIRHFMVYCARHKASDIIIQGGDYLWVEIYGRQLKGSTTRIQDTAIPQILQELYGADVEIKVKNGFDQDRNLEISGEEYGISRGKALRLRCNIVQATISKQAMTMSLTGRIIPEDLPTFETVALEENIKNEIFPINGLVAICGPTGSGKSTLLAAIYHHMGVNFPDRKVVLFEDPIEFVLGGDHWLGPQPSQSQVGRDVQSFAAGIRNAMRRGPKVIGIGEARDIETYSAVQRAAESGHATYFTCHTYSVAQTISKIINDYPPEQQSSVASSLLKVFKVIIVQNLVKTKDGKRQVIREYLIFNEEIRNSLQVLPHKDWGAYINHLLSKENRTLNDSAWNLFINDEIDRSEYISLFGYLDFEEREKNI